MNSSMTATPTDIQPGTVEDMLVLDRNIPEQIREQTLLDWVPISKMFVAAFGRPLNQGKVQRMREVFDPNALGVILLSFRANDTYSILDGQHRVALALEMGRTEMAARIYIDLTYEQEASLYNAFATVNKQSALDKFRAKLEAKEANALDIQRILRRYDLEVATAGPALGKLQAVYGLETIHDTYGSAFLDNVIGTLHAGWADSPRAYVTESLNGMAAFWLRYHDTVDLKRLQDVMKRVSPERVLQAVGSQRASSFVGRNGKEVWGRALRDAYNLGLRKNQLPEWEKIVISEKGKLAYQQRSAAKRIKES